MEPFILLIKYNLNETLQVIFTKRTVSEILSHYYGLESSGFKWIRDLNIKQSFCL